MVKFKKSVKRLNSKWFETVIDPLMNNSGLSLVTPSFDLFGSLADEGRKLECITY